MLVEGVGVIPSFARENRRPRFLHIMADVYLRKDWFVYIAKTAKGGFYVGISTDPQKRIKAHNQGKGSKYARDNGSLTLVYTSIAMSKSEARRREIQIKGWTRSKKKKLISGVWK